MLKLNRINLKLHEFENKYIKSANKSSDSTSDDSISNFEPSPKPNINGATYQQSRENSFELENEHNTKNLDRENSAKLTNGHHVQESNVNDGLKIFQRSNLKGQSFNKVKTFNVMENIKLISLDDSPEDDFQDSKQSNVEHAPEAKISQTDIKPKSTKSTIRSALGAEFSSFNDFKISNRKNSSEQKKENSDIIEELSSPVSDIIEDIHTDESLPPVPSEDTSLVKTISSKASSVSEIADYDYSSEFEKLSDASKTRKQKELKITNKIALKTQTEDKDATLANSSELDHTQSFFHQNDTESEQNQVNNFAKTSENTSPSRSDLVSLVQSNHSDDNFRKEGPAFQSNRVNTDDSENMAEQTKRNGKFRTDSEESKSSDDIVINSDVEQSRKVRQENSRFKSSFKDMTLKQRHESGKMSRKQDRESSEKSKSSSDVSDVETDRKVCEKRDREKSGEYVDKAHVLRHKNAQKFRGNFDGGKSNDNKMAVLDAIADRRICGKNKKHTVETQVLSHKSRGFRGNYDENDNEIASPHIARKDRVKSREITKKSLVLNQENRGFRDEIDDEVISDVVRDYKVNGRVKRKEDQNKSQIRSHRNEKFHRISDESNTSNNEISCPDVRKDRKVRDKNDRVKSRDGNSDERRTSYIENTSPGPIVKRKIRYKIDRVKGRSETQTRSHKRKVRGNSDESKTSDDEITFPDQVIERRTGRIKSREHKTQVQSYEVRKFRGDSDESEKSANEIPAGVRDEATARRDVKSKVGQNLTSSKHRERKLKKSKSVSKASKSNSEKLNNCDSQNSVTGSEISCITVAPIKKSSAHRPKETGEKERKKVDSIKTIKNDISSDFGSKKENGTDNFDSLTSAKLAESFCRSCKKMSKNTQSVNTQTSPKVYFEEKFKIGAEKHCSEDNFRTFSKNFCSCCTNHDRKSANFVAFKSNGNLETVMNHLLMGQLRFIQSVMEKQSQSHKLNRQIIQQMTRSKR